MAGNSLKASTTFIGFQESPQPPAELFSNRTYGSLRVGGSAQHPLWYYVHTFYQTSWALFYSLSAVVSFKHLSFQTKGSLTSVILSPKTFPLFFFYFWFLSLVYFSSMSILFWTPSSFKDGLQIVFMEPFLIFVVIHSFEPVVYSALICLGSVLGAVNKTLRKTDTDHCPWPLKSAQGTERKNVYIGCEMVEQE